MSKKNPLGLNLLKQGNSFGKNKTNPDITDDFIENIINESLEGKEPLDYDFNMIPYHGKYYTLNREGILKSPNGLPMKPFFHRNKRGPRVRIKKTIKKDGKFYDIDAEVGILQLMKQKFGPYFPGYANYKSFPKKYILVPKDGNYENMHYSNLVFENKKLYEESTNKKGKIKTILTLCPNKTNKEIHEEFGFSLPHISKVKRELASEGKLSNYSKLQDLREKLGIQITEEFFPIYTALLDSEGKLSNMEIAKKIWPEKFKKELTNREKKQLTEKVRRVRDRLIEKGLIKVYNDSFKAKREEAIRMLNEKNITGYTNQKIAEVLGLNKQQIDNLARTIKK